MAIIFILPIFKNIIPVHYHKMKVALIKGVVVLFHTEELHGFFFANLIHIMVSQYMILFPFIGIPKIYTFLGFFGGIAEIPTLNNKVQLT